MQNYSKEEQNGWESAPYAPSFTPSASVGESGSDQHLCGLDDIYQGRCREEYCDCTTPFFSFLLFSLDELIRQMAVNCAERGLLLFRIGEEIQMTVSTYKTLYESSIAFGMRKTLMLEKGKADMEKRVKDLNC